MIDAVDTAVTSQKYSLQNDCEMSRWDRFVESHPDGTPFHCSWWLRTILESYAFTPMLHVFTDETDRLTGLFPLFLIVGGLPVAHPSQGGRRDFPRHLKRLFAAVPRRLREGRTFRTHVFCLKIQRSKRVYLSVHIAEQRMASLEPVAT